MLKLRDIMTPDVITVDPQLSIRDAMELLSTRRVSGAPVVAGGEVLGIVSMTDLARFAASLPDPPADQRIKADWDDAEPRSARDGDADAAFFAELWSDAGAEAVEQFNAVSGPEWNVLEEHTVSEAMTYGARSMSSTSDVLAAASLMTEERIHRVLVMDGATLEGIVSLTDIAKAAATHRLTTRTYVFSRGSA